MGEKMIKIKHKVGICAVLAACLIFGVAGVGAAAYSDININEEPKQLFELEVAKSAPSEQESDLIICSLTSENDYNCLQTIDKTDNDKPETYPMPRPEPREFKPAPPLSESNERPALSDRVADQVCSESEAEPALSDRVADQVCSEFEAEPALSENVRVSSRVLELLFGKEKSASPQKLALGGGIFGIKLKGAHVTVKEAKGIPALCAGDIIHSINGIEIKSAEDAREIISKSGGESITIRASRRGVPITLEVRPTKSDGTYTIGLTLRDGAMGIGTLTYYDPETGLYGGLGHGICDADGKAPIEIKSGEATGALLGGVKKGECGKPGELTGIITGEHLGTVTLNNDCGIFGCLDSPKAPSRLVEVGTKDTLHEGEATIISTLKNGKTAEYKIKIYDINKSAQGSKCFRIKVTDETLIALTGGIVRGMSGSPIIQDGKLVGAVTHVMVADPTEGYGIFIENMLNASESARNELPNAA